MSNGRLKAGPLTAAIGLIIIGGLLLVRNFGDFSMLKSAWQWWPLLLVGLGLEFLIKQKLAGEAEVRFHWPSLFLVLILLLGVGVGVTVDKVIRAGVLLNWPDRLPLTLGEQTSTFQSTPLNIHPGVTQIRVTSRIGRVELSPAPDDKLSVRAVLRVKGFNQAAAQKLLAEEKVVVQQKPGDLVEIAESAPITREVRPVEVDYQVLVPQGVKKIAVKSEVGPVSVRNIATDLALKCNLGRVVVTGLKGNLNAVGSTGEISVTAITGAVKVENSMGRVTVTDPEGSVQVRNRTGEIKLTSKSPLNREYALETELGQVLVILPRTSNLAVRAESRLGSISGSPGLFVKGKERDRVPRVQTGTLGQGTGKLFAKTDTGSVQVKLEH